MTLDEFVAEYQALYQEGIDLFTEFDPCAIRDGSCKQGRDQNSSSFCCKYCGYLTETGCSAQSLWCKLWTCVSLKPKLEFHQRATELRRKASVLCQGHAGRFDLSDYILMFFGKEKWQEWKENNP